MNGYLEYQQLDLPWLTSVPAHWEIWKNRRIFTEVKDEVGENSSQFQLLSLSKKGIIPRDMEFGKGKFPAKFNKYKIVLPGYMAFCLFDMDETPRTVGLSAETGMLTGAYTIMKVDDVNVKYAYYYYLSLDDKKALKPLYTGLRKTINVNVFLDTKIPIPPRSEQDQIVRYLDWKLSEITRFVKEKKKEIKLYKELRTTIINNAVTHGINPNVTYKDSGCDWIKYIPEHWEMINSKAFFALRRDKAFPKDIQLTASQKYGIISQDEFMRIEGRRVTVVLTGNDILKHVEKGDFVISMRSFQGGIEYSYATGKISSAYVMLIPNHDYVCDKYFKWLLKSPSYIKALQGTSDLVRDGQALRYANFSKVPLPQLPLEEQLSIADYLDEITPKIDLMIEKIQSEIAHVEELRTKIISDAVTGKVDVRGVEVPDFVMETEDADEDEDTDADNEDEEKEDDE